MGWSTSRLRERGEWRERWGETERERVIASKDLLWVFFRYLSLPLLFGLLLGLRSTPNQEAREGGRGAGLFKQGMSQRRVDRLELIRGIRGGGSYILKVTPM